MKALINLSFRACNPSLPPNDIPTTTPRLQDPPRNSSIRHTNCHETIHNQLAQNDRPQHCYVSYNCPQARGWLCAAASGRAARWPANTAIPYRHDEFKETIAKNPVVMLDAFATWCGPCKAIAPQIAKYVHPVPRHIPRIRSASHRIASHRIASHRIPKLTSPPYRWAQDPEYKDKTYFAKFDVDAVPELAKELGVRAMPTFFFFKDGKKVDEFVGANPPRLLEVVVKHNPEKAEATETAAVNDKPDAPEGELPK